jgi:nucleoside-diphosphate-sugar epimerase
MRIVVVGATGNVGTSVLRSLENEERVESVLGLARRLPGIQINKVEWAAADIARDDLVPHFRGADAVILLAWLIQPSRDLNKLWMVNVEGSMRAAHAVAEARVPALLYASSIGAYSPGPKDRRWTRAILRAACRTLITLARKRRSSAGWTISRARTRTSELSGCAKR